MADSIRSLTIKLGYDVDTTGADIFKASFKRLKSTIDRGKTSLKGRIKMRDIFKAEISSPFLKRLRKRLGTIKKVVRKANTDLKSKIKESAIYKKAVGSPFLKKLRVSLGAVKKAVRKTATEIKGKIDFRKIFKSPNLSGFVAKFDKAFDAAGKKIKANIGRVMVGITAAVAAGVAAATKVFTRFSDIEQARTALGFRAGDRFDEIAEKLNIVREETGNVISELDALNAFNLGADIIGDFDFMVDNFGTVVKLAKVLGKDVGEVQQAFATFVATGSNLQELVKFGFFSPEQIDALKKASTDFSQQGLQTRKSLLGAKISEGAPRLQESFNKFLGQSNASINKLGTTLEDTVIIIGEKINPAISKWADGLTGVADLVKKSIKEGSLAPIIEANITAGQLGRPTTGPNAQQSVSTENNISINVNGSENPKVTAEEVMKAQARAINESSARKLLPQSLNTSIAPGRSF